MDNYKSEIISSRVGCLGGSDGNLLRQVCELGYVPPSMRKRLAVCKGLLPAADGITTRAMRYGDIIEQRIYNILSASADGWQSNPLWESETYRGRNVRLICHPDFVFIDEKKKEIRCYECKTTKYSYYNTRNRYISQLYIETLLAEEQARLRGKGWKARLSLVHYHTDGLDLSLDSGEFDESRLSVKPVNLYEGDKFDIKRAIDIIDEYLDGMDFYSEEDEVDALLLPSEVRTQFLQVADYLRDIKKKEAEVDAFKRKVYDFFTSNNIMKVKCDDFCFTVVPESVSMQFDAKSYFTDYEKEHPIKARSIKKKYSKEIKRKGYVKISVKNKE